MKNTEQKPPSDFEVMADFNRLYSAYLEARKGKRWKYAVVRFEVNLLENLMALHFLLTSRKYRPSPYNYFLVHEPKERLIMYNGFRDKIIQHSLCDNVLEPRLAKTFILDNYASQKGKGTHFGLDRLKAFMQRYYRQFGADGWVLKCDIRKYFYSINHDVLKSQLRRIIDDPGVLWLLDLIIDSTEGPGIPIGNHTSQWFAVLYLSGLDHMIKEAEAAYREHLAAKGPDLKIGKDYRLAEYIERRIVEDGYSPAAVLGEIKVKGIQFNTTICEATLYSYIKKGVFLTLEMVHLPCKGKQKRPYTKVKKNKKAARASAGKSIEKRDPEIDTREEVGHWEMDCVEGKKKTKETLLVLSERKARKEIMIKMKDQTAGSVVAALDRLERRYGTLFYKIFQTITVDNGSEFADVEGLERSCRRKGKRTTVFYCHPYSSYERGTNENINRMIRRWFPKGTDFGQVPKKAIQAVEDWLNAYPREILGFRSADEVFAEGLAALG